MRPEALLWTGLALGLAALASAAPEVLIDTDFGAAEKPILGRSGTPNPRVTGAMAGDWRDDSVWADDVHANWERMEEEGRGFVRLRVKDLGAHWYQVAHVLPRIQEETFVRLSFTGRSAEGCSVQIGIRDSGPPYRFHWEQRVALGASWSDQSFEVRLNKIDSDIGFWFVLNQPVSLDLARFTLTRLTRDDYVQELRARYAEGQPRNLLRTSTFPLGLQSGWALSRDDSDGDDVRVGADPETTGPSGLPALHVDTEEATAIWSAPFAAPLPDPHVASLYAKGTGKLAITVFCEGRQIARGEGQLTGDWQRVWVRFTPVLMARSYGLRIEGEGGYWMDAVQVAAGEQPTDYAPQMPCEVHLSLPASDASAAGVQFPDEPAEVLYAMTGSRGNLLRAKVVSVYGEERDLPVPVLDMHPATGKLSYDAFPGKQFGPFRIEAWVEDKAGTRLSAPNEIVVNRLPRPRYWGRDAPNSPFGVHTLSTTRHNLMAKAVGANWTRLHDAGLEYVGWWWLEREPGKWTFRDKEIERYRRDHLMVLGELGTAPEWASYYPGKPHNGYFDRYYQPKRMEDYANYVRTVAERYKGAIEAWDVWNEPWIFAWWGVGYDDSKPDRAGYVTSEHPQQDFARMMQTAFETAKAVEPSLTILGFNSTTGGGSSQAISGPDWTRGVLEAGGMAYCDVVCYHQYIGGKPGYPDDVVQQGFTAATGPIQEQLGTLPKPVWMTEGSAARDTIGPGFYHYTVPYENTEDVTETADRLCRYVTRVLSMGCERLLLYSMHAQSSLDAKSEWRVIVTPEGALHPSGVAHGILAWHLEDTRFVKAVPVRDDVTAYLFEARDGSRSVAVISPHPGAKEYVPPHAAGIEVQDIWGNRMGEGQAVGEALVYVTGEMRAERLEELLR